MNDTMTIMSERERRLAAVRCTRPDRIPTGMALTHLWLNEGIDRTWELVEAHPRLFPHASKPAADWRPQPAPWRRAGAPFRDSWGCIWQSVCDHFTGAVIEHPLADWSDFAHFQPPDPECHQGWTAIDWAQQEARLATARAQGQLAQGGLRHGFAFLTLSYLRGYENLLFDMVDEEERLPVLIDMVEAFNAQQVEHWLAAGVEWLGFPEDLGMQQGPMLSPEHFRHYIKPLYERLMAPAKKAGVVVYMHSDGDLKLLMDDILDCGVEVINCQDQVNGIDWLRDHVKGRCCIDLDIDRQHLPITGSPSQIDEHIHRCVEELASPEGGLMLSFSGDEISLENAWAMADALERYA